MDKTIQKIKDDLKMRIESQGLSLTRREVRVNQFMENHSVVLITLQRVT
jgi:hypothetical protein